MTTGGDADLLALLLGGEQSTGSRISGDARSGARRRARRRRSRSRSATGDGRRRCRDAGVPDDGGSRERRRVGAPRWRSRRRLAGADVVDPDAPAELPARWRRRGRRRDRGGRSRRPSRPARASRRLRARDCRGARDSPGRTRRTRSTLALGADGRVRDHSRREGAGGRRPRLDAVTAEKSADHDGGDPVRVRRGQSGARHRDGQLRHGSRRPRRRGARRHRRASVATSEAAKPARPQRRAERPTRRRRRCDAEHEDAVVQRAAGASSAASISARPSVIRRSPPSSRPRMRLRTTTAPVAPGDAIHVTRTDNERQRRRGSGPPVTTAPAATTREAATARGRPPAASPGRHRGALGRARRRRTPAVGAPRRRRDPPAARARGPRPHRRPAAPPIGRRARGDRRRARVDARAAHEPAARAAGRVQPQRSSLCRASRSTSARAGGRRASSTTRDERGQGGEAPSAPRDASIADDRRRRRRRRERRSARERPREREGLTP